LPKYLSSTPLPDLRPPPRTARSPSIPEHLYPRQQSGNVPKIFSMTMTRGARINRVTGHPKRLERNIIEIKGVKGRELSEGHDKPRRPERSWLWQQRINGRASDLFIRVSLAIGTYITSDCRFHGVSMP
jgi:hypothetical protein